MKMITNYLKKAIKWYCYKTAEVYNLLPNNGMIDY